MMQWHLKAFNDLSVQELYAILRLRQEVFIVEQNCPYLDADGKDLTCFHLTGYVGNELATYARILPAGVSHAEVSIGRVISRMKYRKHGFGILLMQEAIKQVEKLYGPVPIRIGAQMYLQKFYESFGFAREGARYMEDGIAHIIMLRPAPSI